MLKSKFKFQYKAKYELKHLIEKNSQIYIIANFLIM